MKRDICIDCDGLGRYPSGRICKSCGGSGEVIDGEGKPRLPYPSCYMPDRCGPKGYCQADPACFN